MAKLGDAYVPVHGDFSPIRRQMAAESRLLSSSFSRSFQAQQARNLQAVGRAAKFAAVGLGSLAAFTGAKGVAAGLKFNATMESNELALSRFVGGTKEAKKFVDDLFQTAKRTPFEMTDLTSASRRLLAFGLEADKTKRILSATGDAIAAMGGGAENIDKVTLALGQMQAKGKVSAEELLQLTEAGIPAYDILKTELGLTGDQVANIGNEGIKAGAAIDALTRGMEERFAGAAKQQSKTYEGQISTLKDNTAQLLGAMTEGLFDTLKDDWLPTFNDAAGDITEIWKKPGLTPEQQFLGSFDVIDREFGPLVNSLIDKIGDADLGNKFVGFISDAIPVIAENSGKLGIALAKGLVKGFVEADALGKLFIAGTFVRYLGGWGMIGGLGSTIGKRLFMSMGMAAGHIFTDLPTAEIGKRFGTQFGRAAGPVAAGIIGSAIAGAMVGKEIAGAMNTNVGEKLMEDLNATEEETRRVIRLVKNNPGLGFPEALQQIRQPMHDALMQVNHMRHGWSKSLREMTGISERELNKIERLLQDKPRKGQRALDAAMRDSVTSIRKAMDAGEVASRHGLDKINTILLERLAAYGIEGPDASKILKASKNSSKVDGKIIGGQARGGITPIQGQGRADTVPLFANGGVRAMVAPGEDLMVANRHQRPLLDEAVASRFGVNGLQGFFNKFDKPHFMAGGGIVALGKKLQRQGFQVGEHPAFGGVSPGAHSPTGYHPKGMAIDVNHDQGNETAALTALYNRLKGMAGVVELLWQVPDHFDHLHVAMAAGAKAALGAIGAGGADPFKLKLPRFQAKHPMFAPGAQGMNNLSKAMEGIIARRVGSQEGPENFRVGDIAGPGANLANLPKAFERYNRVFAEHNSANGDWGGFQMPRNHIAAIAEWAGAPGDTMEYITRGESGGRPGATGIDPGGTKGLGLWMITTGFNDALIAKLGGQSQMRNPLLNAKAMKSIYDSQGLGAWYAAHPANTNDHYTGGFGMQLGGMLPFAGSFGGGGIVPGPVGAPHSAIVHGGEQITPPSQEVRRYAITITNWHEGTGYMEGVADGAVHGNARHNRQMARMRS